MSDKIQRKMRYFSQKYYLTLQQVKRKIPMLLTQEDNAVNALYAFIKALKVKVTKRTLKESLLNQPEYPSLFALSQALETWNIENVALNIPIEQLAEVPTPFLAFLKTDGGSYGLVQKIEQDTITWLHDKKGLQREKLNDFAKHYKGTILVAETNEQSGESNYTENRSKEFLQSLRLPFVFASLLLLFGISLYFSTATTWQFYALAVTKFAGVIVSALLLWHQIDKNNAFVKNLCQIGKKTNCNAILDSKAANLFSWLSWAEIGFFYFAGTLLMLLNVGKVQNLTYVTGLLTLLALPYTLYSLYYQVFVAKQYCPLCLTVVGLLWVEALIQLPFTEYFNSNIYSKGEEFLYFSPSRGGWGEVLISFLFPITLWVFIKPFLINSLQVESLKAQLRKFKNNPELFERLLTAQESMPYLPTNMETVIIGDKNADNTLVMVTNPFCPPCAKTHAEIEKLIRSNANLRCQVVFTATNEEKDTRGEVARHLLSLAEDQRAEALHTWYLSDKKDIKKWKEKFGNTKYQEKEVAYLIEEQNTWCKMADISQTPTLYLNGYKLPEVYQISDLKYLTTSDLAKSTII